MNFWDSNREKEIEKKAAELSPRGGGFVCKASFSYAYIVFVDPVEYSRNERIYFYDVNIENDDERALAQALDFIEKNGIDKAPQSAFIISINRNDVIGVDTSGWFSDVWDHVYLLFTDGWKKIVRPSLEKNMIMPNSEEWVKTFSEKETYTQNGEEKTKYVTGVAERFENREEALKAAGIEMSEDDPPFMNDNDDDGVEGVDYPEGWTKDLWDESKESIVNDLKSGTKINEITSMYAITEKWVLSAAKEFIKNEVNASSAPLVAKKYGVAVPTILSAIK